MAKDYGEMEREFIAGLKQDTGRDLAEWMALIAAQGFTDKNDAIDWLRGQGFLFNRASWLERIHANGGRPIYGDKPPPPTRKRTSSEKTPEPPAPIMPAPAPAPAPPRTDPDADGRLEALIASAKGYQPLYRVLAAAIERALPGVRLSAAGTYVSVARPEEFAGIEPSPKGLRLALDLGDAPLQPPLQAAKLTGAPRRLTHMLLLDDARRIDLALIDLLKAANTRVNG